MAPFQFNQRAIATVCVYSRKPKNRVIFGLLFPTRAVCGKYMAVMTIKCLEAYASLLALGSS
jgi:hypothetical protein